MLFNWYEYAGVPFDALTAITPSAPGTHVGGVTDKLIMGNGLTVMVMVDVLVHPSAVVPVTVYVVVTVGVTVITALVEPPDHR